MFRVTYWERKRFNQCPVVILGTDFRGSLEEQLRVEKMKMGGRNENECYCKLPCLLNS